MLDQTDRIVIACNTAHLLLPQLRACTPGQFVSLVDTVAGHLQANALNKVGLLASPTTIRTGLYTQKLQKQATQTLVPSARNIKRVETLIRQVIAGKQVPTAELANLEHELKLQGAQAILLGCTELSVIAKQAPINQFIDPLRLIAEQILPQEEN